ncbi:MAG: HDOD domain-containing protein [Deferrisomatales bacterium]
MDLAPGRLDAGLPTLPAVAARVVALYASGDYTLEQVTRTLEADPPIAGRVLRLANSAYYGLPGKVQTLRRAAVLLGAVTVQAVALGASLFGHWRGRPVPAAVETVWIHAYLTGLAARGLARRLPRDPHRSEPDALFLAGLLHDVGKIWFLSQDPEGYAQALADHPASAGLQGVERERFGWDHAEAGGELLAAWGLPPRLTALVRYHHGPALRAELAADAEALAAANAAAAAREAPVGSGLPPDLVADLAAETERARPEAEAFYHAIS